MAIFFGTQWYGSNSSQHCLFQLIPYVSNIWNDPWMLRHGHACLVNEANTKFACKLKRQ